MKTWSAELRGLARAFDVDGATKQRTPEIDQKKIFVSRLAGPAEKV
jgi:hypothetical protein